ncbi:unnamed protein product [Brachionus calyciflorus]|uniref:Uncharacterized protein n=1 Tax=Brachionus calyciflorus TaxID=104777 RepID=A0A814N7K3_9BILA|nr:unnamed protein product [Brachionus calyciflorus]
MTKTQPAESDYETYYATRTRRLSHAKKHCKEFTRKGKLKSCNDEDPIVGVNESNDKANGRLVNKGINGGIYYEIPISYNKTYLKGKKLKKSVKFFASKHRY